MYTRFDCEAISPDSLAITPGMSAADTSDSPHVTELFCNSGNQTTGFLMTLSSQMLVKLLRRRRIQMNLFHSVRTLNRLRLKGCEWP